MDELGKRAQRIINCINDETADLDGNQRCMVLLYVAEIAKCSVDKDIYDTYRRTVK